MAAEKEKAAVAPAPSRVGTVLSPEGIITTSAGRIDMAAFDGAVAGTTGLTVYQRGPDASGTPSRTKVVLSGAEAITVEQAITEALSGGRLSAWRQGAEKKAEAES